MNIFRLAQRWNAILLIDEADVYMEERTVQDMTRNALVSVFLRLLERCETTIFFTTNRQQVFDPAILSRMHLTQAYEPMKFKTRSQVWERCIANATTRQGPATVDADEIKSLAQHKLNAREVSNGYPPWGMRLIPTRFATSLPPLG